MKRCLAGIGLLLFAYSCSVWAQDAAMFRGNLQHTGVYNAAGVPKFNAIKWKFHTGGRVIASPAVVDGVAYVGSTDGNFYAIDATAGTGEMEVHDQGLGGFIGGGGVGLCVLPEL